MLYLGATVQKDNASPGCTITDSLFNSVILYLSGNGMLQLADTDISEHCYSSWY